MPHRRAGDGARPALGLGLGLGLVLVLVLGIGLGGGCCCWPLRLCLLGL